MTKKNLFSLVAIAISGIALLASCNKSPKEEQQTATAAPQASALKIAYVEVDSLATQYEFCKEYSLILERKSQNIQSTLQQKGQSLQQAVSNFQQKVQQNAYTREEAERVQAGLQRQNADLEALQQRLGAEFQAETEKFNDALHDSLQNFIKKLQPMQLKSSPMCGIISCIFMIPLLYSFISLYSNPRRKYASTTKPPFRDIALL
jgi:outer membrane protein